MRYKNLQHPDSPAKEKRKKEKGEKKRKKKAGSEKREEKVERRSRKGSLREKGERRVGDRKNRSKRKSILQVRPLSFLSASSSSPLSNYGTSNNNSGPLIPNTTSTTTTTTNYNKNVVDEDEKRARFLEQKIERYYGLGACGVCGYEDCGKFVWEAEGDINVCVICGCNADVHLVEDTEETVPTEMLTHNRSNMNEIFAALEEERELAFIDDRNLPVAL